MISRGETSVGRKRSVEKSFAIGVGLGFAGGLRTLGGQTLGRSRMQERGLAQGGKPSPRPAGIWGFEKAKS